MSVVAINHNHPIVSIEDASIVGSERDLDSRDAMVATNDGSDSNITVQDTRTNDDNTTSTNEMFSGVDGDDTDQGSVLSFFDNYEDSTANELAPSADNNVITATIANDSKKEAEEDTLSQIDCDHLIDNGTTLSSVGSPGLDDATNTTHHIEEYVQCYNIFYKDEELSPNTDSGGANDNDIINVNVATNIDTPCSNNTSNTSRRRVPTPRRRSTVESTEVEAVEATVWVNGRRRSSRLRPKTGSVWVNGRRTSARFLGSSS
jgi:hypothetical protein